MARRRKMDPERKAFISSLLEHYQPKDAQDVQDMLKDLLGETLQGMLEAEMDDHLGYSKYDYKNKETDDSRNGYSPKTVTSSMGTIDLDIPRDRKGDFEPQIVKKNQTDISKGTVLLEVGSMLAKGSPMTDENGKIVRDKEGKVIYEPYKIKVLNTINFKKSMHYNPFVYIRSEKDILKLVTTIIANTKGEGQQSGEDFWVKAEKLYYCALIGYIWYEGREEEKNFNTLLEMINVSEAREDDENFKNPVDLMFDELEQKDPNHFAVRQYKKYKLAAGDICSK